MEYDEEDNATLHTSTLDEFEQFSKLWVDLGLGVFSLTTAGVKVGSFSQIRESQPRKSACRRRSRMAALTRLVFSNQLRLTGLAR